MMKAEGLQPHSQVLAQLPVTCSTVKHPFNQTESDGKLSKGLGMKLRGLINVV